MSEENESNNSYASEEEEQPDEQEIIQPEGKYIHQKNKTGSGTNIYDQTECLRRNCLPAE